MSQHLQVPTSFTLPNGIRVCAEHFKGARSFSLCLKFLSGAAEEPEDKLGLATVMEGSIFKGTSRRTAAQLFDSLDALGVERDAGVSAESITFHLSTLPDRAEEALKIYREILEEASFPEEEVATARRLALERIAGIDDKPRSKLALMVMEAALGRPLGRPVPGTRETVEGIDPSELREFLGRSLFPAGMIVTAAGGMDPDEVFRMVESAFGDWSRPGVVPSPHPVEVRPGVTHELKESEQAHIAVVYPGPSRGAEDYYSAQIAAGVLSGSGSSRLFTEVREKRGLVYHVGTGYHPFRDGAVMVLYAGTRADRTEETLKVCLQEIRRLAGDISDEEVERARSVSLGRLLTVGELAGARASALADDLALIGRARSIDEIVEQVKSVDTAQAMRAAERYRPEPYRVAVLGPVSPLFEGERTND